MDQPTQHLEAIKDIRKMMQRSSRFISLSGLSGVAAGVLALAGAWIAYDWLSDYYIDNNGSYSEFGFQKLQLRLFMLAGVVLAAALLSAFYFTWRRAGEHKLPLWDHTSKMMIINILIPLISGGIFIITMLQYKEWRFVVPACLVFYGLSLVNGSKYTLSEIRYLGLMEVVVGLVATQFPGLGLYFWAFGFGVLHIIYGFAMWWKNERQPGSK